MSLLGCRCRINQMGLISSCVVILVMSLSSCGLVRSDFTADKKLCERQLVALTPCLSFVGGDAKTPSAACCVEMNKDFNTTKLCLCILVRDRNEPNLGIKLNATLALDLPFACHVPTANISECLDFLHLAPGSPDARVFEQFIQQNNTSIGANVDSNSGVLTRKKFPAMGTALVVSLWLLSPFSFNF